MKSLTRYDILSFVIVLTLLFSSVVFAQKKPQKQDDIFSQGKNLLKNYQPPQMHSEQPTLTPIEAWKQHELDIHGVKPKSNTGSPTIKAAPLTPKQQQFLNSMNESKNKKSKQEIRKEIEERRAQEEAKGNGINAQLRKRGINVGETLTDEQRQQRFSQFVKEDQAKRTELNQGAPDLEKFRKYVEADMKQHPERSQQQSLASTQTTSKISGYIFNDENKNGIWDTTESAVEDLKVYLYKYYANTTFSTTSDSDGYYEFNDLAPYDYYLTYSQNDGWYGTYDGSSGNYTYMYGGEELTFDFGFWQIPLRSISGTVFNDVNHDGVKDTLEPGLPNWQIRLYDYSADHNFYTQSDSNGYYSFDSLMTIGYFYVYETKQFRWKRTTPYNDYYQVHLVDTSVINQNFGNWYIPPFQISGIMFNDMNGSGQREEEEPGLSGWPIYLYSYNKDSTYELLTDSAGVYTLTDSGDVDDFKVYHADPDAWMTTYPYQSQDAYYSFAVAGDTISGVDFGSWHVPPGSIRGVVYDDVNNNGFRNEGEPGLNGWKFFAVKEATTSGEGGGSSMFSHNSVIDTLIALSDSLGYYSFDSLSWGYYYIFEQSDLNWIKTEPGPDYYYNFVAGDTSTYSIFGNFLPPLVPLRVNAMPSNHVSTTYANAVVADSITVWGNVHGGRLPYSYVLDYGDGAIDSGETTEGHFIGFKHIYATAGPKTMRLIVHDPEGNVDEDESVIRVYPLPSQQIRTNMAIEKGLLYLYLNQYPQGYWYDNSDNIAGTGAALLSLEENGHKPNNNINTDIYAEYVRLGLDYLFSEIQVNTISTQPAGNPDTDGDGKGAFITSDVYANGIASLAVIGAYSSAEGARSDTIHVGAYTGQTFYDYAVDMVDQYAYSQVEEGYYHGRGGWRYNIYSADYGSQDNSTTQWAALDLEAAQNTWGVPVPPFVKSELIYALQYTQGSDGGFGYDSPDYWENITKTAAGLGSYAFLGATVDTPAVSLAMSFINSQWELTGNDYYGWDQPTSGNTYAMYGVAKGMRIINNRAGQQFIGTHDWYAEYVDHLLDNPTWKQNPDGSWPRSYNYPGAAMGEALNSSLAILVLTRGVVLPPPVAVIAPVSGVPPHTSIQIDGSLSFHQDPERSIVEWLWDFDASNGINWDNPDAYGQRPTIPEYADTGTYTITLRVKDNSIPPLYSTTSTTIRIRSEQNPPIAIAIPPARGTSYAAKIGEPILLDGRASYDPDYPRDSVIAFSWDLNGDGIFGDATTDTITVTFFNEHQGQVGLRVFDTRGDSSSNVAYITIVASRKDLFVKTFHVSTDHEYPTGTVTFTAVLKNNQESNSNATHVLVRFYDNDPNTIGNQLGEDHYVNLPIGEEVEIEQEVELPDDVPNQARRFFVFLDPLNQQAEWNEVNNLVSSNADLYASDFTAMPETSYVGDTLSLRAFLHNSESSNIDLEHILVRFYSNSELTNEYQIGSDQYVDLPSGGADTAEVKYIIPADEYGGVRHFYVFVDADNQVFETNEENNVGHSQSIVFEYPGILVLEKSCLNFATVPPTEGMPFESRTINVMLTNTGQGRVYIDSIVAFDSIFTYTNEVYEIGVSGSSNLSVTFKPESAGMYYGTLTIFTREGSFTIQLGGQAELPSPHELKQRFKGLAQVNGELAPPGSVIGAFRTNGTLINSDIVIEPEIDEDINVNYALTLWAGQAELTAGDTIIFRTWTSDCSWKLERYCEPFTTFAPIVAGDTTSTERSILAGDPVAITIPVGPRFNTVSWNVRPENNSVEGVFGSLLATNKVKVILDYANDDSVAHFDYYIPDMVGYNTLLTTSFKKGYFVKLHNDASPDSLVVRGMPVCPENPIQLKSQYNFISYLPNVPESTAFALSSIDPDNFNGALEFSNNGFGGGLFNFFPGGGLDVMYPGKGYVVNVNEAQTFRYPGEEGDTPTKHPIQGRRSLKASTPPTAPNIPIFEFVYGNHAMINSTLIPTGTPIRAIDSNGVVCGMSNFLADGVFVLPVMADNPFTLDDEGAIPGEMVKIVIGANQLVTVRVLWSDFADTYRLDGNLSVTGVNDQTGIPETFGLSQNYPNPFNPTTSIRFQLPVESHVKLTVYSVLGQEVKTLVDGVQSAGFKSFQFDAVNIPNGVYYYRIEAISTANVNTTFVEVKKMLLLK